MIMMNLLETERLIIKIPTSSDVESWFALHAESDVKQFTKDKVQKMLEKDILHHQKYGFGMWSVYEKKHNEFVGRAGLFYFIENDIESDIELGYVLHKAHWGKGYATEIAAAIINWGFEHLRVNRLVAITRPDNKSSQRVLTKIGMRHTGNILVENSEFLFHEIVKL